MPPASARKPHLTFPRPLRQARRNGLVAVALVAVLAAFRPVDTPAADPESIAPRLGPSSRRTSWVITEIHFHPTTQPDASRLPFVEIANTSLIAEPLDHHQLTGAFPFVFSPGTLIQPGERIVVTPDPAALQAFLPNIRVLGGFPASSIHPEHGSVRLLNPAKAVLLEVEYNSTQPWPTTPLNGFSLVLSAPSWGERDPRAWSASASIGGSPGQPEPSRPRSVAITPDRASVPARNTAAPNAPGIVLNEIFYHPVDDDSDLEFVELFNTTTQAVDLSRWRFVDGITYEFPAGSRLDSHAYAVVARDRSRLLAAHPAIPRGSVYGNFNGQLANGGERIALARPDASGTTLILVDEVTYLDGGAWGRWSDGGGSSLELVDPHADNALAASWADSDESSKAPWTTLEVNGSLVGGVGLVNQIQVLGMGAGSFLLDDVQALTSGGINVVANGTFDSGIHGWTASGTHADSTWVAPIETLQSACFQIEATGRGDTGANQVRAALLSGLVYGQNATLRAKARWLRGSPEMLLRLRGNHLEAFATLAIPSNPGTPGAPNSRAKPNAGPALADVTHTPILPAAGESVQVTAQISDPDGIAHARLRYRVDPDSQVTEVPLVPESPGSSRYVARIPGQSAGALAAFDIVATDAAVSPATSRYPRRDPHHEALVRFGELNSEGPLGTYRLWMTRATVNHWSRRSPLDNNPLPVTFVYQDERVVHGVGAFYAGSPHLAPTYDSPTGKPCGYVLHFPEDEPFLGVTEVVLDWPGRDATAQQEPFAYWIARELGIPFNHRRFIRLHVNGVTESQRGTVYEDAQQVNSDLVESWLPNQTGGALHKIEQWFEFNDALATASVVAPRLENYTRPDGSADQARYRWNWLPRAVQGSANDFTRLLNLVDAANDPDPVRYRERLAGTVDLEEWMRVFAVENIVVNFDAWGYDIGKNMYAYAPPGGTWRLFMWDIDWVMTTSAQHGYSPASTLMYRGPARFSPANRDPVVGRMYDEPTFQRAYWRAIADAVNGPLLPDRADARMKSLHTALVAAGVTHSAGMPLAPPTEAIAWIRARRSYLLEQLAEVTAPFVVEPFPEITALPTLTLRGTAPIQARELTWNGLPTAAIWSDPTHWSFTIRLNPGTNLVHIGLLDGQGRPLTDPPPFQGMIRRQGIQIVDIRVTENGTILLKATAEPGVPWNLESTDSLPTPVWTRVASGVTDAAGTFEAIDPTPLTRTVRARFYRVSADP